MEYLEDSSLNFRFINEENMQYIDLLSCPEYIYGTIQSVSEKVDFSKFSLLIQKEMERFGEATMKEMNSLQKASCGCRIRFFTTSKRFILRVQLKRNRSYLKMNMSNSHGFDIYEVSEGEYHHQLVVTPYEGQNNFSKTIEIHKTGNICIFLPNYNEIEKMYLGIEKDSIITKFEYKNKLPVVFYGHSVTQGASASRSGNSFPNIVSRKLDRDIINISCSACCKGLQSVAEEIGKINCHSIVMDYSRNASNVEELKIYHEQFYKTLRKYHPYKKIIIMTSPNFNARKEYDKFDEVIIQTYQNAIDNNENTFLIKQKDLFEEEEMAYAAVDNCHYTDYGMYRVADKICSILKK